ncbi:DUF6296 family protein, partial [Streptomyces sp. V4-01]|nr:DUF6296 family protein [Streptomyces sp. V4-01]
MEYPERYELVFEEPAANEGDTVVVHRTGTSGAGGSPVYEDDTGIVRAEINADGEIRMMASGGHQVLAEPRAVRS